MRYNTKQKKTIKIRSNKNIKRKIKNKKGGQHVLHKRPDVKQNVMLFHVWSLLTLTQWCIRVKGEMKETVWYEGLLKRR